MAAKSSAASLESLYMVFLFHLSGNVVQRKVTFPASLPSFYSTSQRRRLIFLTFEQPQG
jgi:hypothetical protein